MKFYDLLFTEVESKELGRFRCLWSGIGFWTAVGNWFSGGVEAVLAGVGVLSVAERINQWRNAQNAQARANVDARILKKTLPTLFTLYTSNKATAVHQVIASESTSSGIVEDAGASLNANESTGLMIDTTAAIESDSNVTIKTDTFVFNDSVVPSRMTSFADEENITPEQRMIRLHEYAKKCIVEIRERPSSQRKKDYIDSMSYILGLRAAAENITHLDFSQLEAFYPQDIAAFNKFLKNLLLCNPQITTIKFHPTDETHIDALILKKLALHQRWFMGWQLFSDSSETRKSKFSDEALKVRLLEDLPVIAADYQCSLKLRERLWRRMTRQLDSVLLSNPISLSNTRSSGDLLFDWKGCHLQLMSSIPESGELKSHTLYVEVRGGELFYRKHADEKKITKQEFIGKIGIEKANALQLVLDNFQNDSIEALEPFLNDILKVTSEKNHTVWENVNQKRRVFAWDFSFFSARIDASLQFFLSVPAMLGIGVFTEATKKTAATSVPEIANEDIVTGSDANGAINQSDVFEPVLSESVTAFGGNHLEGGSSSSTALVMRQSSEDQKTVVKASAQDSVDSTIKPPVSHKCEGAEEFQLQQQEEIARILALKKEFDTNPHFSEDEFYCAVLYGGLIDPSIDLTKPTASKFLRFKKLTYCHPDKSINISGIDEKDNPFTKVATLLLDAKMKTWLEEPFSENRTRSLKDLQSWSTIIKVLDGYPAIIKGIEESLERIEEISKETKEISKRTAEILNGVEAGIAEIKAIDASIAATRASTFALYAEIRKNADDYINESRQYRAEMEVKMAALREDAKETFAAMRKSRELMEKVMALYESDQITPTQRARVQAFLKERASSEVQEDGCSVQIGSNDLSGSASQSQHILTDSSEYEDIKIIEPNISSKSSSPSASINSGHSSEDSLLLDSFEETGAVDKFVDSSIVAALSQKSSPCFHAHTSASNVEKLVVKAERAYIIGGCFE